MGQPKKIIPINTLKEMYQHYINKTKTLTQIEKEYCHNSGRIRDQFKEQGWKINDRDVKLIVPQNIEKDVCEDYIKNNLPMLNIRIKYNLTNRQIHRVLEKFDKKKTKSQAHTQSKKIVGNYFENINTEDKAYFLGLLYADGCVNKDNNRISLVLQYGDKNIVEKMSEHILQENKVKYNEKNNIIKLQFKYKQIKDDLIKHGCMPVKSFAIRMPTTIPKDLMRHFLRGLFDGDGCIHLYNSPYTSATSNVEFLKELQSYLKNNLGIITDVGSDKNGNPLIGDICFHRNGHKYLFLNYLYKNSSLSINRKFKEYEKICSFIENGRKSKSIFKEIDCIVENFPELKEYSRR